ncbi:putative WD domain-containing protein [Rosellinia necatrix]|uniref:Putative WD domain-containing protein n=1 Tax=Rosellinia necatrix TaxID=77044 RepID=A0A1S8A7E5_ROSNE|nr:putative WD domain-containing protein [Rosellinia necatrix]
MSHEAEPPGRLRREYVLNPITALAFLTLREKQYLLAAEDTDIKIYDIAASRLCCVLPVFHAQPIHGISVPPVRYGGGGGGGGGPKHPAQILVWGGHAVKVLPIYPIEELIYRRSRTVGGGALGGAHGGVGSLCAAPEAVAPDWIFDGRISPFNDNRIVLLTAHNDVIEGHISTDQSALVLGRVRSPSRPILYSGNFFWVERDCVLVAAGTVFGEIVVWKCHLGSGADGNHGRRVGDVQEVGETAGCEVLFVFSGHEGSIFGVHISPEIVTSSGTSIRLLASCSDDRTIRIWDITERSDKPTSEDNEYGTQISDARQTGFGDSVIGSIGLVSNRSRCIATAMGHASRIWQVEIKSLSVLSDGDMIEVYSFGEDATMQRWYLDLGASLESSLGTPTTGALNNGGQPLSTLTHYETLSHHNGKQIWSHAMVSNENSLLIATGGGDGKIALTENNPVCVPRTTNDAIDNMAHYRRSIEELDISPTSLIEKCRHQNPQTISPTSSFKHGNGKEMFQSFGFITDDRLLITTRTGRLFLCSFGDDTKWKELTIPDTIRTAIQSYTILRSSRRASLAFIGAPNGELFYYHEASGDMLWSIYKAERKITEIICLSDTLALSSHAAQDTRREPYGYVEILVMAFGSTKAELLRLDQDHTVTQRSGVLLPDEFIVTTAAWSYNYLVLGSRNGYMSILDLTPNGDYCPLVTVEVKTGDKITSVLPLPQCSENSPLYFLTTSRDGKYRIYEILNSVSKFQFRLLHETKPPFGPLIEGSYLFDRPDGTQDLMLYGFRGKHFVVWNATQQSEVTTIDCGGGHRIFDQVQIRGNPEGLRFACTKASQMKIFSQTRAPHLPLKTGDHGREIKAVSASGKYVATGAEDTMIRIWELRDRGRCREGEEQLRCVLALEKHNTGIQRLKWYKDQYLFSSGGSEEFFAWRVTPLKSDICPLGVVCEAVFPDRTEVGDLRITDFDVQCLGDDAAEGIAVKSEGSRVDPRFCISMTLSNSAVQSYLYSAQHGFQFLGRRMYTGACPTQIRHLNFTNGQYPQVLTAATDGHLAVFTDMRNSGDETEDTTDMLVTKLHQSTIKSLDMCSVATETGTSYLIVTGGDDDAIGVLHLHLASLAPFPQATYRYVDSEPIDTSNSTSLPGRGPDSASSRHIGDKHKQQAPARYEVRNKFVVRSAHAAAVTGLGIVRLENGGRDAVVATSSNDQRVKTWRLVGWQSASPAVHLLDNRYSGVADPGDLEVARGGCDDDGNERTSEEERGGRILVAGVGIEAWYVA